MAYSQNDEEQVILNLLGAGTGRWFLDIGAYDGKTFSNSLRLAELGWSGVCVEPSPTAFTGLLRVHKDNPEVQLVNAAIGLEDKWVTFFDSGGDAVSSTDVHHVMRWTQSGVPFTPFQLRQVSVSSFLAQFNRPYAFVNIDVESKNWDLFTAINWSTMPEVKVICVEYDLLADKMVEFIRPFGFELAHKTSENLIFHRP